ncbi:craniofacial development protein 2 [Trichonephila clavipes]|uniref:Craniofacial development protein 2 n=1 Tax=Trichonephila clavipes TaxID=2585209 RepID=A0A8X6VWE9_TRICX|nr:craniofacial development protein 2 [Trichonephila clavipes]
MAPVLQVRGLGVGLTTLPLKKTLVTKSQDELFGQTSRKRLGKGLKDLRIGFGNIRSLYRNKGLQMLIKQMDNHRIDILAIQESRWKEEGIIEKKNHTIVYSCDKNKHIFGTAFILSKRLRPFLIDFVTKSPRPCKIRIRGTFFNYSFVNIHAPTEDKDRDANAKIGTEKEFKQIVGKSSLHDLSNDNGKRLIDFAADYNMAVPSTMFQHKNIHKITCRSPDRSTCNQIDHLLVDSRHKSDVLDARTYHGANLDSHHFLVMSRVRARISNFQKSRGKCLEKFDCGQLNDKVLKLKFQEQLENKYKEINNIFIDGDSIDKKWNTLKEIIIETSNQVVEKIKKSKKDWFDNDCFMATKRKKEAYSKMLMENRVGDYQNGFQKGRSTTEQIFNIRQVLEKTREFGIDMHHLFSNFKTVYDSINRKALIAAMKEFKIPDKLLMLISLTLSETKIIVKVQNDLSDPLEIKNGIRQGGALVCLLFNIALEKVVRDSNYQYQRKYF